MKRVSVLKIVIAVSVLLGTLLSLSAFVLTDTAKRQPESSLVKPLDSSAKAEVASINNSVSLIEAKDSLDEKLNLSSEAFEQFDEEFDEYLKHRKVRRPRRSIRRFKWESPADTRARLWNVPKEESDEATATAFLRVCISESDGYIADCLGIWQVIKNIRNRKCNREYIRRITECDDNGETLLSVIRRASKYVVGVVPPRSRRQAWIANLELSCEKPKGWVGTDKQWKLQYQNRRCPKVAKLAQELVAGKSDFEWPVRGAYAITWGGRCESGKGACDDDIACSRGLARLYTDTKNAFWCSPGSAGCSDDIDPVCLKRGFVSLNDKNKNDIDEGEGKPGV